MTFSTSQQRYNRGAILSRSIPNKHMHCLKIFQRHCTRPINLMLRAKYSRKSAKNTSSYKLIKSDEINADIDNDEFESNPNWELFGARGFRFYLPGSVGPGWLDQSTTAQVETRSVTVHGEANSEGKTRRKNSPDQPILHCIAQECPVLLRKGVTELFPGCVETSSPQLTIVTITQRLSSKLIRRNREAETEKLAKYFLLAASDMCSKLKMFGYWADFVNPFSGQPYLNPHKSAALYQTDQRFRCLGFRIDKTSGCKIITYDSKETEFVGSLYTTAPPNADFLRDVMSSMSDHSGA